MQFHDKDFAPREPYRPKPGYLSRDVVTIDEAASLPEAARLMREHHIGDLVVTREGRPTAILTDRDLAIETLGQDVPVDGLRVGDITSETLATGLVTDDVFALIQKMKESGVGRLPLLDAQGAVAGIVTAKRLTRILLEGLNDLFEMSEQRKQNEREIRN